jgi:hypothetical protein
MAIVPISIACLQELLVIALQIVFEDDAVNVRALVTEVFGFLHGGAIEFRVMLQLAWLLDAGCGTPAGRANPHPGVEIRAGRVPPSST